MTPGLSKDIPCHVAVVINLVQTMQVSTVVIGSLKTYANGSIRTF